MQFVNMQRSMSAQREGEKMKYQEYREKSKPLAEKLVKLFHKRELNSMLTKDSSLSETFASEIRSTVDQIIRMQDQILAEEVQTEDLIMVMQNLMKAPNK